MLGVPGAVHPLDAGQQLLEGVLDDPQAVVVQQRAGSAGRAPASAAARGRAFFGTPCRRFASLISSSKRCRPSPWLIPQNWRKRR